MMKTSIVVILLFAAVLSTMAKTDIYISPVGNDNNPGTFSQPIATLHRAQILVRSELLRGGSSPITVFLRGGHYRLSAMTFGAADSGLVDAPVVWKSYPGERAFLEGGKSVPFSNWKPINAAAQSRLHPKISASQIVELDLSDLEIQNISEPAHLHSAWSKAELYVDGVRQQVAQYPNSQQKMRPTLEAGWITCNGSKDAYSFYYASGGSPTDKDQTNELDIDDSSRSSRWKKTLDKGYGIWLKGQYRVPWVVDAIRVVDIDLIEKFIRFYQQPGGGMGSKYSADVAGSNPLYRVGSGQELYFCQNLLDEIDEPGEWALDFKDKKIYYFPIKELATSHVKVVDNSSTLLNFSGASNIRFESIHLSEGLGRGVSLSNCNNLNFSGCSIFNITSYGFFIEKSSHITLLSNNIYKTGDTGLYIKDCGNLYTLTSSAILIENNRIYNTGLLAYNPAVYYQNCAGITIRHNLIHDAANNGISNRDAVNCLIEYNEFHNLALSTSDMGAIYSYGGWFTYGNIVRYNLVHHNIRANGLYPDDGDSGDVMYRNIIVGSIIGLHVGGGHDNIARNNLFVDCSRINVDNRGISRNYRLGTPYETNLTRFGLNSDPWLSWAIALKQLHGYKTDLWTEILSPTYQPEQPCNTIIRDNVLINIANKSIFGIGSFVEFVGNTELQEEPSQLFYDYAKMDLRSDDSRLLEKYPDLNSEFPKIGLYKDVYRPVVISREESGGLSNRAERLFDNEDPVASHVPTIAQLDNAKRTLSVENVSNGALIVHSVGSYSIHHIDGVEIYRGVKSNVSLPPGFYLIRNEKDTLKFILR